MIEYVLLDIEGTISDIDFVHKVLFPYSYKNMQSYVEKNRDTELVKKVFALIGDEIKQPPSCGQAIEILKGWIEQDVKHPALKTIQGPIWKVGFESGDFKSHIYSDVKPQLEKWVEQGLKLGIYSSGSVAAQKLFFKYTELGDFSHFFKNHFDLEFGGKKEEQSYKKIAEELGLDADHILFLSDVPDELSAAASAGMSTVHIVRPGTDSSPHFSNANSFADIELEKLS